MKRLAMIVVVLALLSSTSGIASMCAALCAVPLSSDVNEQHSHHHAHSIPAGDSMSAMPCGQHSEIAGAISASPRRAEASPLPEKTGAGPAAAATVPVLADASVGSPPLSLLPFSPPLRI